MGRTVVTVAFTGERASGEYECLVDTGSTHVGLPAEEIERLGLQPIPNGWRKLATAAGIIEQRTFMSLGRVHGKGFVATVTEAPIPLIGYEMLESARLRVHPVSRILEEVPDDEFAPPYML